MIIDGFLSLVATVIFMWIAVMISDAVGVTAESLVLALLVFGFIFLALRASE